MLMFIATIVTACVAPPPRAVAPTAAPEVALLGVYVMTITKEDLSSDKTVSDAEVCENAGVFTFTLTTGHWNLLQGAAPGCQPVMGTAFDGEWKLSGDQMISHQDIPSGCDQDYVHAWKSDGATLNFTAVKDSCPPRIAVFTTHPWVKQK